MKPNALPHGLQDWAASAALPAPEKGPAPAVPSLREQLDIQQRNVSAVAASDPSGLAPKDALDGMFSGSAGRGVPSGSSGELVVNDEGIKIFDKAAEYYKEVRRLVEKYKELDLGETLDVMDDTYADVWAKLKTIETVARSRNTEKHNAHLEWTLTWVDATLRDKGRNVAIHTHRVFFHHAKNPRSEIREGIHRVDRYLDEALDHFRPGGVAESDQGLNISLDEVVLGFDTRGYDEIKRHLKTREREIAKVYGKRFKFAYVDELAKIPQTRDEMREGLNVLISLYQHQERGLKKIIGGVIYSRYVGLLLELKTLEHFLTRGFQILQSGRELFDAQGHYITELDAVVRDPEGKVSIVEARSARVPLPFDQVLRDKILYKLVTYKRNWALLEAGVGSKIDRVVFSIDVGPTFAKPDADEYRKAYVERNRELMEYLKSQEPSLSRRYGFPVEFIFIFSHPEESPDSGGEGR